MSTTTLKKKTSNKHTKRKLIRLDDLEQVAIKLDAIARRRFPDGVIQQGVLHGHEAEIRQESLILAVGGFLQRNIGYQLAVAAKDQDAICSAMERCMAIALSIVKRRMASILNRELGKAKPITEENGGTCEHPAQHQPDAWPPDIKAVVIMRSVMSAVNQGKLSVSNATIVYMICERGMAVEQVAQAAGITRSAVYQQINRVRRVIPEIIDQSESPMIKYS